MVNRCTKIILGTALLGCSASASALDLGTPLGSDEPQWGAGVHFGFAAGGLSVKYNYSDKVTAQGTLGFFGSLTNYGIRGLYAFNQQQDYDLYAFGSVGIWRFDGGSVFEDESVFGFGAGAGIEYTFPGTTVEASAELGLGLVSFDNYSFSAVGLGLGLHYFF